MLPSRRLTFAKPVQGECSGKAGERSFTRLDIAEPQPGFLQRYKEKTISRDVYTNEWTHKPDKLYNIDCPLPYVRNPI